MRDSRKEYWEQIPTEEGRGFWHRMNFFSDSFYNTTSVLNISLCHSASQKISQILIHTSYINKHIQIFTPNNGI